MHLNIRILTIAILIIGLVAYTNRAIGQAEEKNIYEIGSLTITGAKYSDENAIKTISGLRVGDEIQVPGPKITRAIRSLMNLKLFSDVVIIQEKTIGEVIFLEIRVEERPRLLGWSFSGVKKSYHEDLNKKIQPYMLKGGIVTENNKSNAINAIKNFFIDKGYLDAMAKVRETSHDTTLNQVKLVFNVTRGKRIKIQDVTFSGNQNVKSRKLRKQLDDTKVKRRLFASSKFIKPKYEEDKTELISYYNTLGFRDAKIISDSMWREKDGDLRIHINLAEGNKYFYRNITFKGNTLYTEEQLKNRLGINKGDEYNQKKLENRLRFSMDGTDVSSLYLDDGYLAFNVDPVETAVSNDSIDLEMRVFEGPQFTIDKVVIKGNDRTNENVIRRELRTLPGAKFSRSDLIRSQREIINLGYFNQENIGINTPVNQKAGTVDIEYTVEEKPNDQLELSAGYGGFQGLIGTLGVSFNNFSIHNIRKKEAWHPLPQGDGQKLSLRAQTNGRFFQSYNASFTEPWFGGKKPTSFTVGGFYTRYSNIDAQYRSIGYYSIASGTMGLGTRLKWPDDNFLVNATLNFQQNKLKDYPGLFTVANGTFNNLNLRLTLARTTVADPIFPRDGSKISLTGQFTPPYSLFNGKSAADYADLPLEKRFHWLEYHKWRLDLEFYKSIIGKLVLKVSNKTGMMSFYNSYVGLSPFERFELGGDGLSNQYVGIVGKDIIALRGYTVEQVREDNKVTTDGAAVFSKISMELRYPISLNPSSSIYVLGFMDGGNMWNRIRDYRPFDLKRSAGLGLRVFLPMFGILGFDYGFGFDKPDLIQNGSKWTQFGKFSFVLGFEPD
ncbi:MAG: outer membrane protein assembly factor BamA [Saprospiraceae bacterium]|jgi:outer membrane protein insertion porin family|nr:outer membrane protein assembly factor BamA [Saprospiraceae bacterium]MBX7179855.1 outer membrane protein assembly factor BamA [Saprospiraceae bacterium]MCB0590848.1 outer membrane protein assembly factor BamA [Saprospiraceae bacterium]MCO5283900.1 outer membrane protein assembly factor BamA [Saprospiraceae bacterium]MCO6469690.1 outer membrane protein assembly factor BamA [Saprospiraceae bacterium]